MGSGLLFSMMAAAAFAANVAFGKALMARGLSLRAANLAQYALAVPLAGAWLLWHGNPLPASWGAADWRIAAAAGASGYAGYACVMAAYRRMGAGVATAVANSFPVVSWAAALALPGAAAASPAKAALGIATAAACAMVALSGADRPKPRDLAWPVAAAVLWSAYFGAVAWGAARWGADLSAFVSRASVAAFVRAAAARLPAARAAEAFRGRNLALAAGWAATVTLGMVLLANAYRLADAATVNFAQPLVIPLSVLAGRAFFGESAGPAKLAWSAAAFAALGAFAAV